MNGQNGVLWKVCFASVDAKMQIKRGTETACHGPQSISSVVFV